MKKYIKIWVKIIICIFMALNLTSCESSSELNKLAIVMGVGIDKGKEKDTMELTIQMAKILQSSASKGSGNSGGNTDYLNLKEDGRSISECIKEFSRKLNRKLFFSHNQVIILGEDAAIAGVEKYMDFFLRYRETRLLVWILVSKGSASDILNIKPDFENAPGRSIGELVKNEQDTSQIPAVNLKDFASRMMSKTTSAIVPIIEVSNENDKKIAYLKETAVFKKDKMIGTLDKKETRGLLWAINEVKDGVVTVSTSDGKNEVNIATTYVSSKIIPQIKDNQASIKIQIKQEGDLQDETSSEDLANPKAFEVLQRCEEDSIKEEVMSALKKARELNADIFGFGDIIYQHYPKKWDEMQKDWNKIFQNIHVDVNVNAKLKRTGRITKPIMAK
ncbi:spore germination protein KC [Clostridium acidisoli DSM 12555]|uniref:Spore germination protein KC n=1 Tax=Clostridium acidisoli DSM 12555 TaxID=1121291 RepID=A0A1W1XRB7_9CLOT|nr:Ger(x)C family spore germination protein [Clostridium acidisoli]SMC26436.1 spore germination protein KC [Clostridium acidisoli DSM 12555]